MSGAGEFEAIATARLVVRRMVAGDAAAVFAYRGLEAVARYQGFAPGTLADVQAFIARQADATPGEPGGWAQLAVTDAAAGVVVGDLGVGLCDEGRQARFGVTLSPGAQGRGLAAEAVRGLFGWLFDAVGVHRVDCSVDPRNARSVALMRRLGMRHEASHVEAYWHRGAWADDWVFALLAREWSIVGDAAEDA